MRVRTALPWTIAAATAVVALAPAASASTFGGAGLSSSRVGVTWNGTAYARVKCAGGTHGFCQGRITILRGGRVLGSAPLAVRSNDAPSVEVPLGRVRGGRRTALLAGGRSITVVIATHDLFLNTRTTRSAGYLARG